MCRRKIHTQLKVLEYLGALPETYRNQIHPSQLSRYRHGPPKNYFGFDLEELVNKEVEFIRCQNSYDTAKKINSAVLKIFCFFGSVVSRLRGFKTALRQDKSFVVELAQRFKDLFSVRSFSKLIRLDESTLYGWIRQVRVKCSDSLINVCRKVHPNQLLLPEIAEMKKLLTDEEFKFWPLSSLFFYALKNNITSMSKSTWYKYAALINAVRLKPKTIKTKNTGIRALRPNELWHADVTCFITPEKVKLYIYTVIDNFSRFPLCVKVSDKLCGRTRVESFREALRRAVEINPSVETLKLMTDGGSENFNGNVVQFLKDIDTIEIKHIKALSDGWPSNSMVEAFHYVMKIFYLNHMDLRNLTVLNKALDFTVSDYAYKRPHAQLKGLTPFQAYTGQRPEDVSFTSQIESTRKTRIIMNQNHNCSGKCNFN